MLMNGYRLFTPKGFEVQPLRGIEEVSACGPNIEVFFNRSLRGLRDEEKITAATIVAFLLSGCRDGLPPAKWNDLTRNFSSKTIYCPTAEPFKLEVVSAQKTVVGFCYAANNFCAAEHGALTSMHSSINGRANARSVSHQARRRDRERRGLWRYRGRVRAVR